MLRIRRPIVVGGVVMLAAVFTCALVLGEPVKTTPPAKADDKAPDEKAPAKEKERDFAADDAATAHFANKPLLVYQGKDGHRLFALQVQPTLAAGKAKPRDLVILVDTTASQAGGHFLAAEKLVEAIVAKIGKEDRVSIRTVNITSRDLTHGFQSGGQLADAVTALKNELPMGAADLKTALKDAMKSFKGDDAQRAIVYLGDGMSIRNPINPSDIPDIAADMVQDHIAFFHVPMGPRLEPATLHGLASRTGGAPIRLTQKSEMNAVAQTLLETVDVPVLHGASIEVNAGVAYYLPNKLPPLRSDAPTLLVGELKDGDKLSYTLKGTVDGREVTLDKVERPVPASELDNFFVASLVQQWQSAKDQPALIRADRALAYGLQQIQLISADLIDQGKMALSENRYDIAANLFGQARDLDPTDPEAKAFADLVGQLRDGKITKEQLRNKVNRNPKKGVGKADRGQQDLGLVYFQEEEEQAGDKPVAPAAGGDADLADAARRQKVEEQKAIGLVDDVIRQAMRVLPRDPDYSVDYLRRTLQNVRTDQNLSPTTRERLSRRLEASLSDAEIKGEHYKEDMARRAAQAARAAEQQRVELQQRGVELRIQERMRVFHNLMNQAREDEAYRQAQDVRQDLINQGAPVPVAVVSAYMTGQVGYNLREIRELRRVREERLLLAQLGVERSHVPFPDEPPIQFPPTATWRALTDLRKDKYESSRLVGEVAQKSRAVSKQLSAPVTFAGFDDPDTKIDDVMKYFERAYGIPFDINEQAFKDENMENIREKSIGKAIDKMRNVALSTVLRKVLERIPVQSGTTWVIRNGVVEITTGRYAASEKAIVAYPIADLAIPITTAQQMGSVLQPGQLFGLQGGLAGIGGIGGLGGLGGIGGIGGLGGLGGGLGGLGGLGGGLGGLGGIGGLGGLGGGLAGAAGLGGGVAGVAGGLGGGVGGLGGIGGLQGLQGGMGGVNVGLGALGGTQAPLLVKMITQLVGEPDDWAPIDPLQLVGIGMKPGEGEEIDKRPFRNSLAFYPPALALVVKGSSRIQTRPVAPTLRAPGDAAMGALDKHDPNVKVAGAGADRPDKPKLSDWQKAVDKGVDNPGLILACVDFLGSMNQWDHAAELLKADIRSGIIVRPWVYEALAMCLRESNASAEEIERAELSAADLEPLDAQGFLKAAQGMNDLKRPEVALAFCRQAALLEPNVAGIYRAALDYSTSAKDAAGMEWALARMMARDWPTDNAPLHELAESRLKDLAKIVSEGDKGDAADKLLGRLQDARRRDLEITLVWQNGPTVTDLDLVVEEPVGSLCSWRNRQTVGGGILLGGSVGDKKQTYIAAHAFTGSYRVRVDRLCGHPLGDKAQLRVVRFKGTPQEREEIITVEVPRGPADMQKDPVVIVLDDGRRTQVADVPPPETTRRISTAAKSSTSGDVISQLQRLSDPSGYTDHVTAGVDGQGDTAIGPDSEASSADDLAFQTRVKGFATNQINVTAQAVISADRRYVRFSLAPTFNVVTGTQLQRSFNPNLVIPGFPVP